MLNKKMSTRIEVVRVYCTRGTDWALVSCRNASGDLFKCAGTFGCAGSEMVPGQIYVGNTSKKRAHNGSVQQQFRGRPVSREAHALKKAFATAGLNYTDRSATFSKLRDPKTILAALERSQNATLMSVPNIGRKKLEKMYRAYDLVKLTLQRSSTLKKFLPSLFEYLSGNQKEAIEKWFHGGDEDGEFERFVTFVRTDPWRIQYDTEYDNFAHYEVDRRADFLRATTAKSRQTMIDRALKDMGITSFESDPRYRRNRAIHCIREHMKKTGDYWMPRRTLLARLGVSALDPSWPCISHDRYVALSKYAHIERFLQTTFDNIRADYRPVKYTMPPDDVRLDEHQRDAVRQACLHPLFILQGGAGVGKTTVCEHIVTALGRGKVTCAAPTGKAAQRLHELVKIPTYTVHRLVYMSDTVEVPSILLLDEQSMQEPEVLARLLTKRHFKKIIFVGDVAQLTSVGPGQFFRDLCDSDVPKVELTKIYRSESHIASNGQKVRVGDSDLDTDETSFEICRYEDDAQLVHTCRDMYRADGQMPMVLCNTNAEVAGLNDDLRQICNPLGAKPKTNAFNLDYVSKNVWRYPKWRFGQGDSVINIKNYYTEEENGKKVLLVANGEIGTVSRVTDTTCKVAFFAGAVTFNFAEDGADYLRPAYALTVNKAQGSEYDTVVVKSRVAWGDQRERFYTAITRAKQKCVVFEVGNAIEECVRAPVARRKTFLFRENVTINGY